MPSLWTADGSPVFIVSAVAPGRHEDCFENSARSPSVPLTLSSSKGERGRGYPLVPPRSAQSWRLNAAG
jgi:hypothetical protein